MRPSLARCSSLGARLVFVAQALTISGLALGQNPSTTQKIDISRQAASDAVRQLVEQTNFQILYAPYLLQGVNAGPVHGTMTPREALSILLRETNLEVIDTGPGAATLRQVESSDEYADFNEGIPWVEVTARRFSERLVDVPIAVSVITGKTLARRGASTIAGVLQDAPGVSVYDPGSGLAKISIRGIATSLGGNENGYYLDDLPFSGVSVPITPDLRTWDLDRIEVLRGPQGTLFGEGSMGGTIRTLTNNAQLDRFALAAQTGLSHTETGGSSRSAKAMINVPVIGDMLALRVAATDETLAGWIDDPASGRRQINPGQVRTARVRALFRPIDNLHINATYWSYQGSYQYGVNETDAGSAPHSGPLLNATPSYTLKGISGTYDVDQLSLFYGYSQNTYALPAPGMVGGTAFDSTIGIEVAAHELRVSSNAQKTWRWTAGLYRRSSSRHDVVIYPAFGIDQTSATKSTASSVFGEITYTMPSFPLEASLGLRHFRDFLSGGDVNLGVAEPRSNANFSSDNPRLSLAYRPLEDWQIYASASKGFRSGQRQISGVEQIAEANHVTLPSVVKPDSIWTYELGTKLNMLERRLNMEFAVYHSDWRDVAVRIPLGNTGLNGLINSDGTRTDGVDASVSYALTKTFTITFSGGFVDATYAGSVPGTGIRNGSPVDDIPRLTMSASGDCSFPFVGGWVGIARAGIQHASPHQASMFPAYMAGDTINNVNARLSLSKGPWKLSLYGDNLTNDRGATSYRTVTQLSATTTETYAPRLRRRTVGLELVFEID